MAQNDNMDFHKRLKRIEKDQKKFARARHNPKEHNSAPRTPKDNKKKSTPMSTWLVRAVLAYVMFVGVKSFLAYQMGQEAYDTRIAELSESDSTGKALAFVMGAGPLSKIFNDLFSGTERSLNAPTESVETQPSIAETLPTISESAAQEDSAQ